MNTQSTHPVRKLLVALAYLGMLAVNALSTLLPLNGVTPQQVSAQYPNLFVPAGYTFSIWGAIYLALLLFTLYQLGLFQKKPPENEALNRKLAVLFILTSLANAGWIFAFHYGALALSVALTGFMLAGLIAARLSLAAQPLSPRETLFLQVPFSLYFGWLTVAFIANVTALLVGLGWNGFGLSEPFWAVVIIAVGALIGVMTIVRFRDIAYGLVLVWAYAGILVNHLSSAGYGGAYPQVAFTAAAGIVLFLIAMPLGFLRKRRAARA